MAMGLKVSLDFAQAMIESVLDDLDVDIYIDNIAIFSNDYESHLNLINTVLNSLQAAGLKVNPPKCEWCVAKTDFSGYWLTPRGIKPRKKKVDAVLKMKRPENIKQLRLFLGAVTYTTEICGHGVLMFWLH